MNMSKPLLVIGNKNYSSWSLRAWLVLAESGIDFDELRIPLYSEGFREAIRRHNPAGKVPVLVDGEMAIWDTLAIAEYVAEKVPALWPSEAAARARARSLTAEMHSGFPMLREQMTMNCRARGRKVPSSVELAGDIERLQQIWEGTRAEFGSEGPFLFGSFTIADAFFAPVVSRFLTYGVACTGEAGGYMEAVLARPSLQSWFAAGEAETEVIEAYESGR
jgi:glutathione S-transferase